MHAMMQRLRRILPAAGLLVVLGLGVMEVYTRLPQAAEVAALPVAATTTRLLLVVHGSADADNPQFPDIVGRLAATHADDPGTVVHYLRWDPWSDLRLRAAASARMLGRELGLELAGLPALQELQLIVHSSGAYVADALCESYRAQATSPARVQMIFLDAFQIRGFIDWSHGARTHGRCADFALSIFNTDDPAPATNRPLQQAFNIDVTAHPARAAYERNGHYWPVEYFRLFLTDPDALPAAPSHQRFPRGTVREASVNEPLPLTRLPGAGSTIVAGAADLQFALEEIAGLFRADTGLEIQLTLGSSGNFARQIRQGAPFELYLSADEDYVLNLARDGFTRDEGVLYAIGRIGMIVPHGSAVAADSALDDLERALGDGRLRRFAIANPEHAPYGQRAEEALRQRGLWAAVKDRLVYGENVSQAAQFATSGNAQGGIIAYSLALAPQVAARGEFALIPADWHSPLRQRMVLLNKAGPTAEHFYRYLQEAPAREVLRRYGFLLPGEQMDEQLR